MLNIVSYGIAHSIGIKMFAELNVDRTHSKAEYENQDLIENLN